MDITIDKIKSFLEGHWKDIYYKLVDMPEHVREQVYELRFKACKRDCIKNNKCIYCGCPADLKMLVKKSCNKGERFPDLMNEFEWKTYKEKLLNRIQNGK
jgi:hypothetical protein